MDLQFTLSVRDLLGVLKLKFIQGRMGDRQLLMSVVALSSKNYEPVESLTEFYGRFHKSVNLIDN